jgi:hypothetical protein
MVSATVKPTLREVTKTKASTLGDCLVDTRAWYSGAVHA